jgi:hypothetical protein
LSATAAGTDSKQPSPDRRLGEGDDEEEAVPEEVEDAVATSEKLPPLPNGVSEPDAYGVRLVTKRKVQGSDVQNRIMVPALFEYDQVEIGFRDSTNDKSRGATKAKRGKYLGTPNSNTMHFDRMVYQYDATHNDEEDLDAELVKKFGVHPKYGIFLKTSVNEQTTPPLHVSGKKPIVYITRRGGNLQTSRSIQLHRLDRRMEQLPKKLGLKSALEQYLTVEGLDADKIQPPQEVIEEHHRAFLEIYKSGQAPIVITIDEESAISRNPTALAAVASILEAAAKVEMEEATKVPAPAPRRRSTVSRPFDPVRDAFVGPESPIQEEAPVNTNLRLLADAAAATRPSYEIRRDGVPPMHTAPYQTPPTAYSQEQNLDPRLFDGPTPSYAPAPVPPAPSFLQTALNHQPQYTSIAPAPLPRPYPGPLLAPAPPHTSHRDISPARVPFSNPAQGNAPPGLPALRPARNLMKLMSEGPADPDYGSPRQIVPNNGGYYQPAPIQPYQSTYAVQEYHPQPPQPPQAPHPSQQYGYDHPPSQQPPASVLQPAPAMHHPVSIQPAPLGPPAQHQIATYAQEPSFGNYPQLQASPVLDQGMRPETSSPPSRHRASLSSGSGQGQSSKYRKLEPAPTPPHRMGWNSNGTELRTVQYDYREGIKDYNPVEPPPRSGPTQIRGWAHNSMKKSRGGSKSEASPEQQDRMDDMPPK